MTEPTTQGRTDRRGFFKWGVGIIATVFSALLGVPLIGYFFSVFGERRETQWVRVCSLDQVGVLEPATFPVSFRKVNAAQSYQENRNVFVIRKGNDILAFSNVCTHMGCSVRWLAWRQQILCPCHGGIYDRWGNLAGGPPPAGLPFYETKIEGNDLFISNRTFSRQAEAPGEAIQ